MALFGRGDDRDNEFSFAFHSRDAEIDELKRQLAAAQKRLKLAEALADAAEAMRDALHTDDNTNEERVYDALAAYREAQP